MKHLNSQKGFSPIIAVILIAVVLIVGGGAYLLGVNKTKIQPVAQISVVPIATPTPDPIANWKTYASKYNTYSIMYPSGWYIYEYKQSGGTGISDVPNPEDMPRVVPSKGHTSIIIGELFPNNSIFKDVSSKQISINSYTGFRRDQTTSYGLGEVVDLLNPNKGNNVELTKYVDDNSMFDQILSTFKFTDQNQTVDTSTWKTYTNKELGFSINYPNEWEINDSCSSISGNKQYEQVQFLCTLNLQSYSYKTSTGASIIDVNSGAPNGSIVNVHVYSNPKNLDTEKFVISKEGLNHGDLGIISKEKKGNNDFIKESYKNEDISGLGSFYIKGNEGKAFWISGTIFAKDGAYQKMSLNEINKYRDIYEKIISTFKFTP